MILWLLDALLTDKSVFGGRGRLRWRLGGRCFVAGVVFVHAVVFVIVFLPVGEPVGVLMSVPVVVGICVRCRVRALCALAAAALLLSHPPSAVSLAHKYSP